MDGGTSESRSVDPSPGRRDSAADLSRDDILANAKAIVEATDLPVSADLENGFGDLPEDCALTIRLAIEAGLVGGSIEDATGRPDDPIYDFDAAVERVRAAAEARAGKPFILTARSENFLWGRPDLADTIRRLQAFSEAGADVLYAPGLPDIEAIATVCRATGIGAMEFQAVCKERCKHLKFPESTGSKWLTNYHMLDDTDARRLLALMKIRLKAAKHEKAA